MRIVHVFTKMLSSFITFCGMSDVKLHWWNRLKIVYADKSI